MIYALIIFVILLCMAGFILYYGKQIRRLLAGFGCEIKPFHGWLIVGILFVVLAMIKSIFIVTLAYSFLLFLLADICRLILKFCDKNQVIRKKLAKLYLHGVPVLVIAIVCSIYAAYNARVHQVTQYEISVDKSIEQDIQVIMVSDIHAGTSVNEKEIDELVEDVNQLNGDVICLGGDIFDEGTSEKLMQYTCEAFAKMQAKHGVYYISGNHDVEKLPQFQKQMEASGVKIIDDMVELIDNRFYLIGRMDLGMSGMTKRATLEELLAEVNPDYPIILLDHRPTTVEEGIGSIVDLQISGHTHAGQIFPGNLMVGWFNDVGYGMEVYDDFHVIVSSGYGTWGFPVRVGSHCEVVNVTLKSR